jgi:hypothetical protein
MGGIVSRCIHPPAVQKIFLRGRMGEGEVSFIVPVVAALFGE